MDITLHQQLLDAATVLLNIDKREKDITYSRESIEIGNKRLAKEREEAYMKPSKAWMVWGIILLYFPIGGTIASMQILVNPSESGVPIILIPVIFFITTVVFCIPSILLFSKRSKLMKARNSRIQKYERSRKEADEHIVAIKKAIADEKAKLENYKKETQHYLEFLAPSYDNLIATLYIFKCIRDGRADTLKEAKNLYEEQLHKWKVEKMLGDVAKMQDIQNKYVSNALSEISQNQQNINATLSSMQAVQLMDCFKN